MKHLFLFMTTVCILQSYSQAETPPVYYGASAVPPSPTAAGLGKYGDVPVSLFTGVPEISIPLYTIAEGNLSVPVSISYHSQGFKVEDMASWVGLGWSLNAGGVITRAVKGVPDDFNGDNWGVEVSGSTIIQSSYGFLSTGTSIENLYNSTITSQASGLADPTMTGLANDLKDGIPDIFYFNFPGGSGQFMFDKNGNIQFFSQQNYKITYVRNTSGDLIRFDITDGNGNVYVFDQIETTKSRSFNTNGNYITSKLTDTYLSNNLMTWLNLTERAVYNSSWYLSKIKNATGNHEINLAYVSENQRNFSGISVEYAFKNGSGGAPELFQENEQYSYNFLENTTKRLSGITWGHGKLEFAAAFPREDANDNSPYQTNPPEVQANALTTITIKDNNNLAVKKFNFNYGYFQAPGATVQLSMYKKLKLLSLMEQDNSSSLSNPPYTFEYDETIPMAPRFSQRQDYWGYLKAATALNDEYTPKVYMYPNDPVDTESLSEFAIFPRTVHSGQIIHGNYDKATEPDAVKSGIIKKITYPTGGSTTFEFEPHEFYLQAQNRTGGGVRIKKITDFDGLDHARDIIKNYSYKQSSVSTLSSGNVFSLPLFAKRAMCSSNNSIRLSNNSIAPLGSTMGSHVAYSEVTVEHNGNGKTVSKFNLPAAIGVNQADCQSVNNCIYNRTKAATYFYNWGMGVAYSCYDRSNAPFADNPNYDWNRGALLEELIYDNQNRLVQQTVNEYTIKDYKKIYAFTNKLMARVIWNGGTGAEDDERIYKYAKHYYISAWKVLSKQSITTYNASTAVIKSNKVNFFFYENALHKQLSRTSQLNSMGNLKETIFKRCLDFNTVTGYLTVLKAQNRLNEVIEAQQWLTNGTRNLVSSGFTEYKDFASQNGLAASQLLPYKSYLFETSAPVVSTNVTSTTFSGSTFALDSRYKAISESNFDAKDNLTRQSVYNAGLKNNSTNVFGHSKNLLIAQVSNATEADCGFTSFESDDQSLWSMDPSVTLVTTDGYCGTSSRLIPVNTFGPTRDYVPSPEKQNKKFIFSCWVKTNASAAGTVGNLVIYTTPNDGTANIYPNVSGAYVVTNITNTNNTWKYIEVEIDLKQVKLTAGLPANTTLGLRSFAWNTNASVPIQVDDLRFYPKEARMTSYTYKPSIGASSVSDENSNCQYFEYDSFGRLKLVKDQNGKILEKTEYNYRP